MRQLTRRLLDPQLGANIRAIIRILFAAGVITWAGGIESLDATIVTLLAAFQALLGILVASPTPGAPPTSWWQRLLDPRIGANARAFLRAAASIVTITAISDIDQLDHRAAIVISALQAILGVLVAIPTPAPNGGNR